MAERLLFSTLMRDVTPPWLHRTNGFAVLGAIADQCDDFADRMAAALKFRFPALYGGDSLPYIGADRKIPRAPGDTDSTYGARLLRWWDSHRTRGGAIALLEQLYEYIAGSVQVDCVNYNGLRYVLATDGTITRDQVSWGASGDGLWSQVWLFFHLTGAAEADEYYTALPKLWNAAHVLPIKCVLLTSDDGVRLWGYPSAPPPTWGGMTTGGLTWADTAPTMLTAE